MNLNALRKEYSKLTPRERLYAFREATRRGDDAEAQALAQTAPKVIYSVTHHFFLNEAWSMLTALQVAELLDKASGFYMGQSLVFMLEGNLQGKRDPQRIESIYDDLLKLAALAKEIYTAWRVFCESKGADPDKMLADLPSVTLPEFLREVDTLAPGDPDPASLAARVAALEEVFQVVAGEQSGGWG